MNLSYRDPRLRNLFYRFPPTLRELLVFPYSLQQRRRFAGAFAAQLAELQDTQYRNAEELRELQLNRLRSLLSEAGTNVRYYRELFGKIGFDPDSVRSVEDLRQLPLLEKETVREQGSALVSESPARPSVDMFTSGSTGKSLRVTIELTALQRHYACMWFHYGWAGIKRGDRVATIAGHPVASPQSLAPPFWLRNRLDNELLFSSQHIAPTTLPLYADALSEFEPALIAGYPSSIYLIALYLRDAGRHDIHPWAVFTASESLLDSQRAVIEGGFGCKAYSSYGQTERSAYIVQCHEGRFHVVTNVCVVEVLDPAGNPVSPGQEGELVCTGLTNYAMPLIRYRVGDTGVLGEGPCSCGVKWPVIESLTGRIEDIVITPDGRHVGRLDHVFNNTTNVQEAQIVQDEIGTVVVRIVPRAGFGPRDEQLIIDELRLRLGDEIGIKLELVDVLPRTASGKLQFVVSKVAKQIGRRPRASS